MSLAGTWPDWQPRVRTQDVSETAGRYLQLPKGPITGNLFALVRPELQLELRSALFHAFEKEKATVSRSIMVQFDGHVRRVVLAVRPYPHDPTLEPPLERQALVFFIEHEINDVQDGPEETPGAAPSKDRDLLISQSQAEI